MGILEKYQRASGGFNGKSGGYRGFSRVGGSQKIKGISRGISGLFQEHLRIVSEGQGIVLRGLKKIRGFSEAFEGVSWGFLRFFKAVSSGFMGFQRV